jgi:hypothetical protein
VGLLDRETGDRGRSRGGARMSSPDGDDNRTLSRSAGGGDR